MYGAILGDIAGSRFEFSKPHGFRYNKVELFASNCFYTDDTVMSVATKYAVQKGVPYARAYGLFGRRYPRVGYGTMFKKWLDSRSEKGYNSFGNGAAMRVSYIGRYFKTLEEVEKEAAKSAICTHNHPEGIKGAVAAAGCTFLAKNGYSKKEIRRYVQENFDYNLSKPLLLRRPFPSSILPARAACLWQSFVFWKAPAGKAAFAMCSASTATQIPSAVSPAGLPMRFMAALAMMRMPCCAGI